MSKFEYIAAALSIVMAFALSEILSGMGRLIRDRQRVRFYWVHVSWMAFAVLWMIQFWWGTWDLRTADFDSFFKLLLILTPFLTYVILAFLLVPTVPAQGELDLQDYYFRNQVWIFMLAGLILIEMTAVRKILGQESLLGLGTTIRTLGVGLATWLAFSKTPRVHAAAVFIGYALLLAFVLSIRP